MPKEEKFTEDPFTSFLRKKMTVVEPSISREALQKLISAIIVMGTPVQKVPKDDSNPEEPSTSSSQ